MTISEDEIRRNAFAMPFTSPAYPVGPYRFFQREFFIVTYRTDPDKLAKMVPAPLEPAIRSSSSSSSGCLIPAASATTPRAVR